MTRTYLASVDCGTSLVKSAIVDVHGDLRGLADVSAPCTEHADGRIESDPRALVNACFSALRQAVRRSGVSPRHIEGVSITNQRATVLCLEAHGEALADLEVAIKESGAVVTHDPLPTVTGDDSQLVQLLQNLIANAIKFRGEAPPRIHVSAARQEKEWVFSVHDNGIGIERRYFDRIFIIFQRLHARHEYSGTGIGLAICRRVVERHGGRLWVESEPGKGSTFYFTMPTR